MEITFEDASFVETELWRRKTWVHPCRWNNKKLFFTYIFIKITKTEHTLIRSFSCSQGGKIHASCKRSQMFRVQRDLPIGEWRFVENFTVSQAGGQYRPTNLQYKMTISGDIVISKSDLQKNNNFLDLASYADICNTCIFQNK